MANLEVFNLLDVFSGVALIIGIGDLAPGLDHDFLLVLRGVYLQLCGIILSLALTVLAATRLIFLRSTLGSLPLAIHAIEIILVSFVLFAALE